MINLIPSSSSDRTTLTSISTTVSEDGSIKDYIYTFTESYYDYMLTSVQNYLLENKPLSSINKESLEWLIPNSAKFDHYIRQNNKLLLGQLKVIAEYIANTKDKETKKDNYTEQFFGNRSYQVTVDVKDNFLKLPDDMANLIDKSDLIESALRDSKFYKKMATKLYFIGFVPLWVTKYATLESMTQYLEQNSKTIIYEGFYTVKELLARFYNYLKNFDKNFEQIKENVKRNKRQLDFLLDKIIKKKRSLLQIYEKDDKLKPKLIGLFKIYEAIIDLFYMQISVYQRSIITLYGKMLTEIGNVTSKIFHDINNDKIQASVLQYIS